MLRAIFEVITYLRVELFLGEQKSWNSRHRHPMLSMSYMYTVFKCVLSGYTKCVKLESTLPNFLNDTIHKLVFISICSPQNYLAFVFKYDYF